MSSLPRRDREDENPWRWVVRLGAGTVIVMLVALTVVGMAIYNSCRIEVPTASQAVLIRKIGLDLPADAEIAPVAEDGRLYKGVQPYVLTEGRYFYNPINWDWEIREQFEVPVGKIGVRIALVGDDLPPGQILAGPGQKGILPEVLKPGRYPYNWYGEMIELHDPVTVPPGFQGVVTLLAGRPAEEPNVVLVKEGERGVQPKALPPGTYFLNPYAYRVSLVDCRSKRFNLGESGAMDFLSADGFPVSLDGAVEFRVKPESVAEVFVLYNEDENGDRVDDEIIKKIITPESRSICRIGGSRLTGGQFISGVEREKFQEDFDRILKANCAKQGVEILAVSITSIRPPEAIATPVREREVAKQELDQFVQEKAQQLSEAKLRVEEILAEQKKAIVEADQAVIQQTTLASQEQAVAKTGAEQRLAVARKGLEAVKAKADAVVAQAEAEANVIRAKNKAEVAGLDARVRAFSGDGSALAENILIEKVAPAFRSIMTNSDGPLMDLFGTFSKPAARPPTSVPVDPRPSLTTASAGSPSPVLAVPDQTLVSPDEPPLPGPVLEAEPSASTPLPSNPFPGDADANTTTIETEDRP